MNDRSKDADLRSLLGREEYTRRDILMTTLATGLALVPLVVLGQRPGHEIEHPLAVVILGGLVTSTLLSLLYVPVVFTMVDDIRAWIVRRLHLRFAAQMGEPVEKAAE